jgi:hypothetical protein
MVPARLVYNLNIDLRKRIALVILFSLGILAGICGIVKTTYLATLGAHSDITWETYNLIVWAGSEEFVLIFCGSIPPLRPLWDRYISRKVDKSSQLYNYHDGPSNRTPSSGRSRFGGHRKGASPLDNESYDDKTFRSVDARTGQPHTVDDGIQESNDIEISSFSSSKPLHF